MDICVVLGLGPSLSLYKPDGIFSIGVNDIWKYHKTDVVVCVDEPSMFTPERLKTINDSTPEAFYSHLDSWSKRPDFKKINLLPHYPDYECQLYLKDYPKSRISPFIACVVAYKVYRAKEIHLYGVDLINHPNYKPVDYPKIQLHFKNLRIALRRNGSDLIVHGDGILKRL